MCNVSPDKIGEKHRESQVREELVRLYIDVFACHMYLNSMVLGVARKSLPGGVVALSGASTIVDGEVREVDQETFRRISLALDCAIAFEVPLVLCGADEQREWMQAYVEGLGPGVVEVVWVGAGPEGQANTKTQAEALAEWAEEEGVTSLIAVSSRYHWIRVVLTLAKNADQINWFVVSTDPELEGYVPSDKVFGNEGDRGELARVREYVAKGDLCHPSEAPILFTLGLLSGQ